MATDNKIISKSETFAFLGGSHVLSVLRGFPKVYNRSTLNSSHIELGSKW